MTEPDYRPARRRAPAREPEPESVVDLIDGLGRALRDRYDPVRRAALPDHLTRILADPPDHSDRR